MKRLKLLFIVISSLTTLKVESRQLKTIELYTNDERCNAIGVCSNMNYGNRKTVVSFNHKPQIRFTSNTTYKIKERQEYFTLTFINSKFSNFPQKLFQAFSVKELDFRNCSLKTLKTDNFLNACQLSILLLSENLLKEVKPKQFILAENLSILLMDSNRLSSLHNDSFKGLKRLKYLDLHNNLIKSLPSEIFSHLTEIQQINLSENRLKIIERHLFSSNPQLLSLNLQRNAFVKIHDYAFQHQENLKYLDISYNSKMKVFVSTNLKVENLWAKSCSLKRINIYGEAVHVDFQHNAIKELYFSKPEYLESLRLKYNSLEQISSLSRSINLRILDISHNPLLKSLNDLWKINTLERLDVSNTSLTEIPINISNKLKYLNVSFNQIQEINPLCFKNLQKLSQFYIHHNNWNCSNLQMLMDMVIKPLKISYTRDKYDNNFPGQYIQGIKCMDRLEHSTDEYYMDDNRQRMENVNQELFSEQEYNHLNFENYQEVEKLRNEFKTLIQNYKQKFSLVMANLNDLDLRLKAFERFNNNKFVWQQVSILV